MATADDIVDELQKIVEEVSGFPEALDNVADLQANYLGDVIGEVTQAITTMHEELAGHFTQLGERIRQGFDKTPPGGVPRGDQQPVERPGLSARRPGEGVGSMIAGRGLMMLGAMIGKVTAALAPLAIFGSALQSATSGFQPFLVSVKMVGVVLGGMFLPFMVLAAGATYAFATLMHEAILPVLGDFYKIVFMLGGHELVLLTEKVRLLGKAFDILMVGVDGLSALFKKLGIDTDKKEDQKMPVSDAMTKALLEKVAEKMGVPIQQKGKQDPMKRFFELTKEGMNMAAVEIRRSIGGQGGFTGLKEAQKEAITAGLNLSPFQRKILDWQTQQLAVLEQILGEMRRNPPEKTR